MGWQEWLFILSNNHELTIYTRTYIGPFGIKYDSTGGRKDVVDLLFISWYREKIRSQWWKTKIWVRQSLDLFE